MLDLIMNAVTVTVVPPAASAFWGQFFFGNWRRGLYLGWIYGAMLEAIAYAIEGAWVWSLVCYGNAALALFLWWLSRRRRKRAPRHYGAKSKAMLAALVRRAREAVRPRVALPA